MLNNINTTTTDEATLSPPAQSTKIRVLHVISGEFYAGAERVQDLLALCLPEFGFDVGFACLKAGSFPTTRVSQNARLFELHMRSRLDFGTARRLAKVVTDHGYSIIHAHTPRSAMVGRLASSLAQVPMVYHVHSPAARDSTRWLLNHLNSVVERFSLKKVAKLVTVSNSLRYDMLAQGYDEDLVVTIPNGVPSVAQPNQHDKPLSMWTLGTVALFRPRKGLEVLIDAVALLKDQGHSVRLRAVGPFENEAYRTQIMKQVDQLGLQTDIVWTGFTQDINAELANMDMFVLPSLFGEGMPMVILEAMAAGVPIVATAVEGVPEAIRDGVDGLLCQPGDADSLACAIAQYVSGHVDARALRKSALIRHAENFSDQVMASRVASVYREVLEKVAQPTETQTANG